MGEKARGSRAAWFGAACSALPARLAALLRQSRSNNTGRIIITGGGSSFPEKKSFISWCERGGEGRGGIYESGDSESEERSFRRTMREKDLTEP